MRKADLIRAILLLLMVSLFLGACAKNKRSIDLEERGMFSQKIKIRTLPTNATIYINEKEIGTSPLTYKLSHEDNRMINIKAIPIYPNQYTQNIFLMVPPIPKTMTIYMNHYPEDYDRNKENEFVPPQKPDPIVIVETQIDTVYVETQIKDTEVLALPAIYFDTDKFNINPSEVPKLQKLVQLLQERPGFNLDIFGFADSRASEKYNLTLTLNRAKAVKEYLVDSGISASRLYIYGHGKVPKISSDGLDMDLSESRKVLFSLKEIP